MSLIASCHCGAVKLELPHLPASAKACNCSFCARTGAVWGYYPEGEIAVLSAEEDRVYSATGMNLHHFCGRCGMQTWGDSPDWASAYNMDGTPKAGVEAGSVPPGRIHGVNLRLIDDLDWSSIEVEEIDGRHSW